MATKRSLEGEEVESQEGGLLKKTKIEGEGEEAILDLVETRILIENHEAGTIIGKGGSNVMQIRQDSKAFVSILKTENTTSKERVLVLKGTTDYNAEAVRLIVTLLVDAQVQRKQKMADEQGVENTSTPPDACMKLLIHKLYAGAVIGKGGSIIKEIKEESGSQVQLSNEPLPGSTEKTITLKGTADQVHAACLRILNQMKENPLRGSSANMPYTPGAAALQAQAASYNPYANPYGAPMGGAPGMFGQHQQHQQQQHQQHPSPYGQPPQMGGMQGGFGAPPQQQQQPGASKTEKIVIPTVCAGSVIGKGGSIIRDIKAQSGAVITIADPAQNAPGDRVVSVIGNAQAIQTAIYLIRQRVEAYTPPGGAAPGQPAAYGGY